jgi:hypothetical protein
MVSLTRLHARTSDDGKAAFCVHFPSGTITGDRLRASQRAT